jgi:MFS transporter, ACS family, tartrate transporter
LGGWIGPSVLGVVKQATGNYRYGLWYLSASVILSALIIASLGIGGKAPPTSVTEAFVEPV